MQAVASNIMQVIGPVNQVMENTKAYSGKPPKRILGGTFPHITIQMPVYKEGLGAVIKPTVMSLKAAISTYELQGGTANIFINDGKISSTTTCYATHEIHRWYAINFRGRRCQAS